MLCCSLSWYSVLFILCAPDWPTFLKGQTSSRDFTHARKPPRVYPNPHNASLNRTSVLFSPSSLRGVPLSPALCLFARPFRSLAVGDGTLARWWVCSWFGLIASSSCEPTSRSSRTKWRLLYLMFRYDGGGALPCLSKSNGGEVIYPSNNYIADLNPFLSHYFSKNFFSFSKAAFWRRLAVDFETPVSVS